MTVPQLLQTVDELIYQIVVLVVQIPKTLFRVIADPTWAHPYVETELAKEKSDRFDVYTPPVLFWALIGVVPYLYLLELLAGAAQSRVATESEWIAFARASWEQRFLVVSSVALAVPLGFSITTLHATAASVTRSTLRTPFLTQCYILTPAFLALLPGVASMLRYDQNVPSGSWTVITTLSWVAFWAWLAYAETRMFRARLQVSWGSAIGRAFRGVIITFLIFFGLELVIISIFNGLDVWLTTAASPRP